MDQTRAVSRNNLTEEMEQTRASIRDTVVELKDKVGRTFDWHHYVSRYPEASLALVLGASALVGWRLGRLGARPHRAKPFGQQVPQEAAEEARKAGASGLSPSLSGRGSPTAGPIAGEVKRAAVQSLARAGSRLEAVFNRLIDDLIDAIEVSLVPALTGWFRADREHSGYASSGRVPRQV